MQWVTQVPAMHATTIQMIDAALPYPSYPNSDTTELETKSTRCNKLLWT